MAQEWCLFYGVLFEEKASKLYKIGLKRKGKSVALVGVAGDKRKVGSSGNGSGGNKKAVILADNNGCLGVETV